MTTFLTFIFFFFNTLNFSHITFTFGTIYSFTFKYDFIVFCHFCTAYMTEEYVQCYLYSVELFDL